MSKCECWRETPNRKCVDAECFETRERDACSCGGDQMKCDFYPEIREKANIKAAIAHYNRGINEDIFSPEVATYACLAVEALREMDGRMDKNHVDLDEWPPEPKMEVIREGLDLPLPLVMAPAIALIVLAVLRQMFL